MCAWRVAGWWEKVGEGQKKQKENHGNDALRYMLVVHTYGAGPCLDQPVGTTNSKTSVKPSAGKCGMVLDVQLPSPRNVCS